MYTVRTNLDRGIIDARLGGFLSSVDVDGYVKDVRAALILNQFHRGYSMIIDVSECRIQTQDTLATLRRHMASMPKAQRIAVVVGNTPGIGQVRRLFTQSYARLVGTREEGLAWLSSGASGRDPLERRIVPTVGASRSPAVPSSEAQG